MQGSRKQHNVGILEKLVFETLASGIVCSVHSECHMRFLTVYMKMLASTFNRRLNALFRLNTYFVHC